MVSNILVHQDGFNNIIEPRSGDLGYDLIASSEPIFEKDFIEYETDVRIEPTNKNIHALVLPRSSISKTRLVLANSPALIDNSYRGSIRLRFRYLPNHKDFHIVDYNNLKMTINEDFIYKKGDKIGQLVFIEDFSKRLIECTDLSDSERGNGGFGSTGK